MIIKHQFKEKEVCRMFTGIIIATGIAICVAVAVLVG